MTFYPGMTHLMEMTVLKVKNRSHTITAEVEIPEEGAIGVTLARGGRFAGWSLYVKDGAAKYVHNFLGLEESYVGGDLAMPVTDDYPEGDANQFTGKLNWVRIDLEEDDVSHLEPEDQRYHRIIARQ